ncbi:2-C-methyl-D-erythritol 2,4-cyclodiphosphate synthase [Ruminococcaceae bacterium YRB3002]|nr:2-C-methyl-D-erythritol 2,4-cyclodiphosphate synthase [Ruminococcaceae bacterium YRB3002]
MSEYYITTIGQDSHRFGEDNNESGVIMLGGVEVPYDHPFVANSDGDVLLHALTNAISGYTGVNVLGGAADKICLEDGIKDSTVYLKEALKSVHGASILHVSATIECLRPKLKAHIPAMKSRIATLLDIPASSVGITATTGEGLTGFGRGEGVQVFVLVSWKVEG